MQTTYVQGNFGFQPLRDLIVIQPIVPPVRQNGIIVASVEALKPNRGRVLATGPGKVEPKTGKLVEVPVKPGDIVTFVPGSIQHVKVDGHDLDLVPATALLGVEV
jgi:chaperonin GroES